MRFHLSTALVFLALASSAAAQEPFDTPDAAMVALTNAAENHNTAQLALILGPDSKSILTSGDPAQDKAEQSEFLRLYRAKHQLKPDTRDPARVLVSIGDEDWPFPIPIIQRNGKWIFDADDARIEMRARRIGADELDAIEICSGYVQAQKQYAAEDRDKAGMLMYASHMISAAGRHDGLYWQGEGQPLVPRAFAEAVWSASNPHPKPYHGYLFRVLDGQGPNAPGGAHDYRVKNKLIGGFGLVAWPANYGATGIHTFIVNQDGKVYEKDIPPAPGGGPSPIVRYDPDPSWTEAD